MHAKTKGLKIVALRLAILVLVLQTLASATFPGKNGRIAFRFQGDIYSINPDGSGLIQLTNFVATTGDVASWLHWSPDGKQIAFELDPADGSASQLWLMNADGSDQHMLASDPNWNYASPNFSPDGSLVVFTRCSLVPDGGCSLFTVRSDGTGLKQLTTLVPGVNDYEPVYGPDGRKIYFDSFNRAGVIEAEYSINADGSSLREVSLPFMVACNPDVAPDGRSLIVATNQCGNPLNGELWQITPQGIPLHEFTNPIPLNVNDHLGSWSPQGDAIVFTRSDPNAGVNSINVLALCGEYAGQERSVLTLPMDKPTQSVPKMRPPVQKSKPATTLLQLHRGNTPVWGTAQ
jgi:Tol biopolymer transport system component